MNPAEIILLSVVLPMLLIASGIVSGSESALFGLTQADRVTLRKHAPAALASVEALHRRPRSLLTAILLANNLVNVLYFTLASVVIIGFEKKGHHVAAAVLGVGSLLAIVLIGEVIAKTTASSSRATVCRFIGPFWLVVIQALWPLWSGVDRFVMAPLTRLITAKVAIKDAIDPTDLGHLLTSSGEQTAIDTDEQRLLLDVFRLGSLRARDVMIPRVELDSMPIDAKPDEIEASIREHRMDQILFLDESEEPVGFLSTAKYLAKRPPKVRTMLEEPMFVPEQTRLDGLLSQLRKKGKERAAVVDERGELVGVVRVEDVVAELFDEASDPQNAGEVQILGLGKFRAPGRMPAHALLHDFDPGFVRLDSSLGKVSTVGGVVLTLLGRLPDVGDSVQIGRLRLTVAALQGRAIEWVEIELLSSKNEGKP